MLFQNPTHYFLLRNTRADVWQNFTINHVSCKNQWHHWCVLHKITRWTTVLSFEKSCMNIPLVVIYFLLHNNKVKWVWMRLENFSSQRQNFNYWVNYSFECLTGLELEMRGQCQSLNSVIAKSIAAVAERHWKAPLLPSSSFSPSLLSPLSSLSPSLAPLSPPPSGWSALQRWLLWGRSELTVTTCYTIFMSLVSPARRNRFLELAR